MPEPAWPPEEIDDILRRLLTAGQELGTAAEAIEHIGDRNGYGPWHVKVDAWRHYVATALQVSFTTPDTQREFEHIYAGPTGTTLAHRFNQDRQRLDDALDLLARVRDGVVY